MFDKHILYEVLATLLCAVNMNTGDVKVGASDKNVIVLLVGTTNFLSNASRSPSVELIYNLFEMIEIHL